ncbi:MAG: hypothetical protein EOP53_17630 [Sphingobacteriales bacterium]|nr:MAG: hypothetical protein EOP53_17630 [Sphingobacteriales bacterium]
MKKLLLLLMVASFGIAGTATAQKNSKKHSGYHKNKHGKKHDRRDDDRDYSNRRDDDRRYDNDRWDDNYDRRNANYNNNAPRKVRDAFNREYPNANNVTWTKDRGVWTASFKNGGLFGGRRTVSYAANGRKVDNNNMGYGKRENERKRNGIFYTP